MAIAIEQPGAAIATPDLSLGRAPAYLATVQNEWRKVSNCWENLAASGAALPFQRRNWLSAWYETAGLEPGIEPLLVTLRDNNSGKDVMGLPLVRRRRGALQIVTFADGGLTDYNAPVLGAHAPDTVLGAQNMMDALRKVLAPADLLVLEKMPVTIGGRPNPFRLVDVLDSRFHSNVLDVPGSWEDWHWGLERTFRKELERCWRVFNKHEGARFVRITDQHEGQAVFAQLKDLQGSRIRAAGLDYVLDSPRNEAFYNQVLERGLRDGSAVLTALLVKDEVIGALLGITDGSHYAMVRLGSGGDKWKTCSPGRMVIEQTMKLLHSEGYRSFDFTIGDYAYKRRLGVKQTPLCELRTALSWRGAPSILRDRLERRLRADPLAMALADFARRGRTLLSRRAAGSAAAP
jgi:CelD/BcsL family acetyltransferase involved in cellulose biosynthesis